MITHDELRVLCEDTEGATDSERLICKACLSMLDEVEKLRRVIKTCPAVDLETQLNEAKTIMKDLANRHKWQSDAGPCICKQHQQAHNFLAGEEVYEGRGRDE